MILSSFLKMEYVENPLHFSNIIHSNQTELIIILPTVALFSSHFLLNPKYLPSTPILSFPPAENRLDSTSSVMFSLIFPTSN